MIESRGNLYLRNTNLNVQTAIDTISLLAYRADKDGSFMNIQATNFTCPSGFIGEIDKDLSFVQGNDAFTTFFFLGNK